MESNERPRAIYSLYTRARLKRHLLRFGVRKAVNCDAVLHLAGRAPIAKLSISIPLGRTSEQAAVQCVRCGLPPRAKHRVLEYIVTHLNENITNEALAEVAGLSVCHFARMFKETVGVSPHRYVLQCRVECARELLASTDMPLSEIAIVTGFSDQSHYTRWFREIIGVTPSSYRWSTR